MHLSRSCSTDASTHARTHAARAGQLDFAGLPHLGGACSAAWLEPVYPTVSQDGATCGECSVQRALWRPEPVAAGCQWARRQGGEQGGLAGSLRC